MYIKHYDKTSELFLLLLKWRMQIKQNIKLTSNILIRYLKDAIEAIYVAVCRRESKLKDLQNQQKNVALVITGVGH